MSVDLPDVPMTPGELARYAGVERRIVWRAIVDGLITADRETLGLGAVWRIPPTECARVARACEVAQILGAAPAAILRARDVQPAADGRTVTLVLREAVST